MLLHRSPRGVISTDGAVVILRSAGAVRRVTREAFHGGALDAAVIEAFDLVVLVEALARDMAHARGISFVDPTPVPAGRSGLVRLWMGAPEDPRHVWIRGRVVEAKVAGADYEAPFDVHLANGFPKAITDAFAPEVIEMVRARVATLAALPCFCHTGTEYIEEHDTLETVVSRADPNEPPVSVTVGRCTVCGTGWTFGRNTARRLGDGGAVHPFAPAVGFLGDEVDRIVAGIRAGAEVVVGGSRCHTTYRGSDGALVAEDFDEGSTEERPIDERSLRGVIDGNREDFLDVLRKPLRERLRAALLEGAPPETVRAALAELLAYGDCLHGTALFEAVIAWPETRPTPDEVSALARETTGNGLFHAVMSGIGYGEKSAAGGRFGLRFFATVAEILGDDAMPEFRRYRAHFRAMAGDLQGALDDLLGERPERPDDALDREIAGVRERIAAEAQRPRRSLTVLVVSAADPDALDAMSYAKRREDGLGWTRMELLHPGEPDGLVRQALDLDMGVYAAARVWDADAQCVEETSCIFSSDLERGAALLSPHVAAPNVLAARLIAHARSGEDPKRVARALVEAMAEPAGGPAEEAAAYVRVFFEHLPHALKFGMGIAWESRTPAPRATPTPEPPAPPPPLPALAGFAEEVARLVGGTAVPLGLGASPASSVRIGAHCVLLIREHDGGFALSLPLAGSWVVRSLAELASAQADITSALASHPQVVSLSDVVAYLSRIWAVDRFTDRPVPREAWLRRGEQVIALSQTADAVTITAAKRTREVAKLSSLEGLAPWIDEQVGGA